QNIGNARIADEGHFLRRCTSCERVMKIPKRMLQRLKEIMCDRRAVLAGGALKTRPIARKACQRGQPALRMIYRTRTAQPPCVGWQNEPLQLITTRPPAVPQLSHVVACRLFVHVEVRRFQETSY